MFVTGSFSDTVDFDFGSGLDLHDSNGGADIFVSRINRDGSYGWTRTIFGAF